MKLIDCPYIGARPQSEFVYGHEVREMPKPSEATDKEWAAFVFNRAGHPGVKKEWWHHVPSGIWFVFERDTLTDKFIRLVDIAEVQYEL